MRTYDWGLSNRRPGPTSSSKQAQTSPEDAAGAVSAIAAIGQRLVDLKSNPFKTKAIGERGSFPGLRRARCGGIAWLERVPEVPPIDLAIVCAHRPALFACITLVSKQIGRPS